MSKPESKKAEYLYFEYSVSQDCYLLRHGEVFIREDEELRLSHIPGEVAFAAYVLITDDGRVLKNRHGGITPRS